MIISFREPLDQGTLLQSMRLAKIIQRAGVVSKFGIHQPHEEMWIHFFEGFQIHAGV